MGSVNVHSSNSSKESGKGAVLSINQSSQDPATPIWDKDKEIKKEEPVGLQIYDRSYLLKISIHFKNKNLNSLPYLSTDISLQVKGK